MQKHRLRVFRNEALMTIYTVEAAYVTGEGRKYKKQRQLDQQQTKNV
jgi:hypothetical protein